MRYNDSPIKKEIYARGFTINSLCDKVGICRHTIYDIEKKKRKTTKVVKELIAEGLGISYEEVCELCKRT